MSTVAEVAVERFEVRGNYPNQRSIFKNLEERSKKGGKASSRLPGYLPPVARVLVRESSKAPREWREIRFREIDLPLLMQCPQEDGRRHLSRIVRARQGDSDARRTLGEESEGHYQAIRARFRNGLASEDKYVIPSTSSRSHPETLVSHKGSILLSLSRQGYPVPDFVILTSEASLDRRTNLETHLRRAVENLERLSGQRLGSPADPLVFAMRCAMPYYIPGLMPTYLNVGITERSLPALEGMYGRRAAYRMYLNNLRNLLHFLGRRGRRISDEIPAESASESEIVRRAEKATAGIRALSPKILDDAFYQAMLLALRSYRLYRRNSDLLRTVARGETHHPAIILQKMVCTVRDERSYAGVLCTRNPMTGTGSVLETGRDLFGEDIMTGSATTQQTAFTDLRDIKSNFPAVYHFAPRAAALEREFQSPVTIEFAAETNHGNELFALLQANETGMTGRAAFISVVDMHKSGTISRKRVTQLIHPYHVKQMESDSIHKDSFKILKRFSDGVAVLPRSAVCARIYFSAESAMKAKKRGERVCFCKQTFLPADTMVMREVDAIVSLTSAAIHVVTICQSFGTPALLNLEEQGISLREGERLVNRNVMEIGEGEWVTISSRRQALFKGKAQFKPARFTRYLKGEKVPLADEERAVFSEMAYAYRYYHQLVRGLKLDQVSTLKEVIRLVNLELRGQSDEAREFVNGWFDGHDALYVEEVFKSDIGDHLNQHTVFDMLTLARKVRFFRQALGKCWREKLSGYSAGAFMLGRFVSPPQPARFWRDLTPRESGQLLNEWILFEKYIQVLYDVGERRVARARKKILKEGLGEISLSPKAIKSLITLKLAKLDRDAIRASLPEWADPQTAGLLDILEKPYEEFFDYSSAWSKGKLVKLCEAAGLTVPGPEEA